MNVQLSTQHLCALFDVDARTIRTWQARQIDPLPVAVQGKRGQRNFYDPRAVFLWGARQELNRAGVTETGEVLDFEQQRARLTKEQADGQAMKNAQLRRELAPIELITWTLNKIGTQITAILDSVPLKVKRRIPTLNNTQVELIRREIVKAQNVAAKVTVDLNEYEKSQS